MKTNKELLEQALQVIKTYMEKAEHKRTKLDDENAKQTCVRISESLACLENLARNAWKDVLIDELVCIGICNAEHEINPKKALNDIIKWNCEAALDPAVSTAAVNLIETHRPNAPWVGLSAKDFAKMPRTCIEGAIWAEAILREKNSWPFGDKEAERIEK